MKILFIVLDGLGDEPIKQLKNKTPLEAASTPNLDYLTQLGSCGLMIPVATTALPTSEEGHFSLFGYNPRKYHIRRGIFTAQGSGIKLRKGDVALRANFSTVDKNRNIVDRRAGRITETKSLIDSLRGIKINGVKLLIRPAGQHRLAIVLRGKGLSAHISDGDPHYSYLGKKVRNVAPLDKSSKSVRTAKLLNEFLEKAHPILENHPQNRKRRKNKLPAANYILTRGASTPKRIPSFKKRYNLKACCVAGKLLYQQIAKVLGMKLIYVKGANGLVSTNLKGKFLAAQRALKRHDFVFLHIKATDSLAEDGNFLGKKKFIEKIDQNIKPLLNLKNTLIIVTADHSTCCGLKRHCAAPIPILVYGKNQDSVERFSERDCQKGKLGKFRQVDLMAKIIKMIK